MEIKAATVDLDTWKLIIYYYKDFISHILSFCQLKSHLSAGFLSPTLFITSPVRIPSARVSGGWHI